MAEDPHPEDTSPEGEAGPVAELLKSVDKAKLSRRTLIKVGAATAVAAGVAATVLEAGSVNAASQLDVGSSTTSTYVAQYDPFANISVSMNVNGTSYTASVEPRAMLINVLRENFGLTGAKRPCNRQECGGCTVLVDGVPRYSCTYLASRASGHAIMTVENGQLSTPDPVVAAIQAAWVPNDASQCGFCQPGRIMAATALLKSNPNPTVDEIKAGLQGVLCRCGTYVNVIAAVQAAANTLSGGSS